MQKCQECGQKEGSLQRCVEPNQKKKKAPSSPCNPEKGFEEQAEQLTFKQLNSNQTFGEAITSDSAGPLCLRGI